MCPSEKGVSLIYILTAKPFPTYLVQGIQLVWNGAKKALQENNWGLGERMRECLGYFFLTKGCFSYSRFIFGVPAVEGLSYSTRLSPLTLIESKFHKQSDKGQVSG